MPAASSAVPCKAAASPLQGCSSHTSTWWPRRARCTDSCTITDGTPEYGSARAGTTCAILIWRRSLDPPQPDLPPVRVDAAGTEPVVLAAADDAVQDDAVVGE